MERKRDLPRLLVRSDLEDDRIRGDRRDLAFVDPLHAMDGEPRGAVAPEVVLLVERVVPRHVPGPDQEDAAVPDLDCLGLAAAGEVLLADRVTLFKTLHPLVPRNIEENAAPDEAR